MATDATGTPTSLGIRKYNTSVDAPSGLGFNGAMDDIDALLVARTKALTAAGDLLFASAPNTPARLPIGSTGNILTVAGGLPSWAAPAASGTELFYAEFTADVAVTTSQADVVSAGAQAYDGSIILVEFFAVEAIGANGAAGEVVLNLFDGATDLGIIGRAGMVTWGSGNLQTGAPVRVARRLTPSVASHTYKIRAAMSASTGTIKAGAGGAATTLPGYIRITKAA